MSNKTRSCQSSREKLRMVRALLPDTPRPHQFQHELQFFTFFAKLDFSRFTNKCLGFGVLAACPAPARPSIKKAACGRLHKGGARGIRPRAPPFVESCMGRGWAYHRAKKQKKTEKPKIRETLHTTCRKCMFMEFW